MMIESTVTSRFEEMRSFYRSGSTRDLSSRLEALDNLDRIIRAHEREIADALKADLGKSAEESYVSETSIVLEEIRRQRRNLRRWSKDKMIGTPLFLFPSRSRLIYEPKGVVLIIAPWNYPFQLTMDPLVGAIAAGNCVALKPSTTSAATCAVIKKIISECFPTSCVTVFDGGHDQTAELLTLRFDHIFFTGGSTFGRTVMEKAAENLIPVTLELGGKSPCIVDKEANLGIAARRIIWGKLMNAGQTCIAPDYLLVHHSVKSELIDKMKEAVTQFYGEDIRNSDIYPRIISDKAFERLTRLINGPGNIVYGGQTDAADRFIAPTFIEDPDPGSPLMQEEIFGPILPIITFDELSDTINFVNDREKPLAFYYFGNKQRGRQVLARTTSGGACINDTLVQIANAKLPFGGTGMSGMGQYHGIYSLQTFSNIRGTVVSSNKIDIKLRYPPYKRFGIMRKLL